MTGITSIALTGFFVWAGLGGLSTDMPSLPEEPQTAARVAPASVAVSDKTFTVKLTAYNAVPEQTDDDPFTTASGAFSNPQVVAARSRDLAGDLPFGTVIALESPARSNSCGFNTVEHLIGYRVIADVMHQRMQNKIDVLFDQNDLVEIAVNGQPKRPTNPARALGICTVQMRVVGKIDIKDIPQTQSELAMRVERTLAAK